MFEARESAWHEEGTWKELHTPEGKTATFTCPKCGETGRLDLADFSISADGVVDPSVDCPTKLAPEIDCPFHDHVKLVGWTPEGKHDYRTLKDKAEK